MTIYDIGDSVRVEVDFTDRTGVATDPTTITLRVRTPRGTATTYTYGSSAMVRSAAGSYYYDITATEAGSWHYKWTGTGALVVSETDRFEVRRDAA